MKTMSKFRFAECRLSLPPGGMSEPWPGTEEGVRGHEAGDINQTPRSTFWVFAYLGYGLGQPLLH